ASNIRPGAPSFVTPSRRRLSHVSAKRRSPGPVPHDARRCDAEIIVTDHGTVACEVRVVVKLQGFVRIDSLSCAIAPRAKCRMCLHSSAARPRRSLRLLSCHGAGRVLRSPNLLDECTTTCDMPRTVLESLNCPCRLVLR